MLQTFGPRYHTQSPPNCWNMAVESDKENNLEMIVGDYTDMNTGHIKTKLEEAAELIEERVRPKMLGATVQKVDGRKNPFLCASS